MAIRSPHKRNAAGLRSQYTGHGLQLRAAQALHTYGANQHRAEATQRALQGSQLSLRPFKLQAPTPRIEPLIIAKRLQRCLFLRNQGLQLADLPE